MKAVVVDIKDKYAVVMNSQGEFIKIKNNGELRVGYEVDVTANKGFEKNVLMKIASIAAMFIIAIGLSFGAYSYSKPYSYIDIDINPSVEITTNIFDRIIETEGLNEDGEKLLIEGRYKHRRVTEGIKEILERAVEEGYLQENDENTVLFTISGKDEKKVDFLEKYVEDTVAEHLEQYDIEGEILVEETSVEKHHVAKKMGISPGKLSLINKLIEQNPELKVDELKNLSVKEIRKGIKRIKKEEKDLRKDTKEKSIGKEKTERNKDNGRKIKEEKQSERAKQEKDKKPQKDKEKNINKSKPEQEKKKKETGKDKDHKSSKEHKNDIGNKDKKGSSNRPSLSKPETGKGADGENTKKGPDARGPDEKNKGAPAEEHEVGADGSDMVDKPEVEGEEPSENRVDKEPKSSNNKESEKGRGSSQKRNGNSKKSSGNGKSKKN